MLIVKRRIPPLKDVVEASMGTREAKALLRALKGETDECATFALQEFIERLEKAAQAG